MGIFRNYLYYFLNNFKEFLFHHITADEIALITNTNFFADMPPSRFQVLLNSIQVRYYEDQQLIFREGSVGNGLYIVDEGAVLVFTHNKQGKKIPLARLGKGTYFGEQALLGHVNKSRNASIEAIGKTKLLKIRPRYIQELLSLESFNKTPLLQEEKQQLLHKISNLAIIKSFSTLLESKAVNVITYQDNETIFEKDDFSDAVYIVLQGKVSISIPQHSDSFSGSVSEGDIFGELGVLQHAPRTGSAKASGQIKLLRIEAAEFKRLCANSSELSKVITLLKHTYSFPKRGSATQFFNEINGEPTITTTYKLSKNQIVEANLCLHSFNIQLLNSVKSDKDEIHTYSTKDLRIVIVVSDNCINSISCVGEWRYLSRACYYLLDRKKIDNRFLANFTTRGYVKNYSIDRGQIICSCMGVSKTVIEDLIEAGTNHLDAICEKTGAGTVCGNCRFKIMRVLGHVPWVPAILKKYVEHNAKISSYLVQAIDDKFNSYTPGQHIVLQVKVDDYWIERAYTITEQLAENIYVITIKHQEEGLLSTWLENHPHELTIYASQPQGEFCLSSDLAGNYQCFASGIGIVPYLSYLRLLQQNAFKGCFHVIYIARNKNDFIFLDEFEKYKQLMPNFKLTLWNKKQLGKLDIQQINNWIKEDTKANVYICGSERFVAMLNQVLDKMNYDKNKIHVERFSYSVR